LLAILRISRSKQVRPTLIPGSLIYREQHLHRCRVLNHFLSLLCTLRVREMAVLAQVMYAQRPIQARAPAQRPHHLSKVRLIQCHQRRASWRRRRLGGWQRDSGQAPVSSPIGIVRTRPSLPRTAARPVEVVIGEGTLRADAPISSRSVNTSRRGDTMPDRHPIIAAGLWASWRADGGEREAEWVAIFGFVSISHLNYAPSQRSWGEQITRGSDLVNAREVISEGPDLACPVFGLPSVCPKVESEQAPRSRRV
jgi:hypothetical protein